MTAATDLYRRLAAMERTRLAEIEYAIERRAGELSALYERRDEIVRAITELDEKITEG